ncbi:MAG TPA: AbiH family protein, partial [Ferruginibacter sp.]|nr:AbiH family protein [Ferruginibacter sp.]
STIINFNYTNFLPAYLNTYYVHGNIDDFDKIVFGLDMNIKGGEFQTDERKTKFEISLHKNKQLLKFSKISQLLHLQVDKTSVPLNIISTLSIIGHGIGEQDYSYFFSILDRNADSIQINCFWYKFNEEGDNKESTKEALFEMLTSYEKYSNQRILHKMIFEGRIKFKEVFIPNIYH